MWSRIGGVSPSARIGRGLAAIPPAKTRNIRRGNKVVTAAFCGNHAESATTETQSMPAVPWRASLNAPGIKLRDSDCGHILGVAGPEREVVVNGGCCQ